MLEIKSTRGKHSTEKPVALMEWILKYYSKEKKMLNLSLKQINNYEKKVFK